MFDLSKNTIDNVAHQMTMKNIFFPDAAELFSLADTCTVRYGRRKQV